MANGKHFDSVKAVWEFVTGSKDASEEVKKGNLTSGSFSLGSTIVQGITAIADDMEELGISDKLLDTGKEKLAKAAKGVASHADKIGNALGFTGSASKAVELAQGKAELKDLGEALLDDTLQMGAEKLLARGAKLVGTAATLPERIAYEAAEFGVTQAAQEIKVAILDPDGSQGLKHSFVGQMGLDIVHSNQYLETARDVAMGLVKDAFTGRAETIGGFVRDWQISKNEEKVEEKVWEKIAHASPEAAERLSGMMKRKAEMEMRGGGKSEEEIKLAMTQMDRKISGLRQDAGRPQADQYAAQPGVSSWMDEPSQGRVAEPPALSAETQRQLAQARGEGQSFDTERGSAAPGVAQQREQAAGRA